jgi:hypothetical protein
MLLLSSFQPYVLDVKISSLFLHKCVEMFQNVTKCTNNLSENKLYHAIRASSVTAKHYNNSTFSTRGIGIGIGFLLSSRVGVEFPSFYASRVREPTEKVSSLSEAALLISRRIKNRSRSQKAHQSFSSSLIEPASFFREVLFDVNSLF